MFLASKIAVGLGCLAICVWATFDDRRLAVMTQCILDGLLGGALYTAVAVHTILDPAAPAEFTFARARRILFREVRTGCVAGLLVAVASLGFLLFAR